MNAQLKPHRQRVKTEAAAFVPASREEVDIAIAKIGELQRERERLATAMNDELARTKEQYEASAAISAEAIKVLMRGVQMYCETNRNGLTNEGKRKTVKFGNGEVRWRACKASVAIRGAKQVIEALKNLDLKRFVRSKESVNKAAILLEPDAVKGVKGISVKSVGEDFVIVPFSTDLEEVV